MDVRSQQLRELEIARTGSVPFRKGFNLQSQRRQWYIPLSLERLQSFLQTVEVNDGTSMKIVVDYLEKERGSVMEEYRETRNAVGRKDARRTLRSDDGSMLRPTNWIGKSNSNSVFRNSEAAL
ncbi:hypothetical protein V6N13_147010 [Hibiscus sabdariffa]